MTTTNNTAPIKYECVTCAGFERCADCSAKARAAFYARKGRVDPLPARLAEAAARKAADDARLEAERARFTGKVDGSYQRIADSRELPERRRVAIRIDGQLVTFAVLADVSPRAVQWDIANDMGQATDGAFECVLVSYETDEQMAARQKEAA